MTHRNTVVLRIALMLLGLALGRPQASADDLHYQTFLIGQRALGMGGAATGVADEPSAAFYNPAGLALIENNSVGGSLSVNAFDLREIELGYSTGVGQSDLRAGSQPAVPIFGAIVRKFGKKDENGIRPHAVSYSTIIPARRRLQYGVDLRNTTGPEAINETFSADREDRILYTGGSIALRLNDDWSVGISAWLVTRKLSHRESNVVVTEGTRTMAGTLENSTLFVSEQLTTLLTWHIVSRLGVTYTPNPHWRFGLMFQPPGVEIRENGRVRERTSFADQLASPPYATYALSDQSGLSASSPIPWELRFGMSWAHSEAFMVAADVSMHGPSDVTPVGSPAADANGFTPQFGKLWAQSYGRSAQVNLSVGIDALIADVFPIRVGFFTDRSAAPAIIGPTDTYAPADVNRYGATLAVGYRSGRYDVSVGAALLFGQGTALAPADGSFAYEPRDLRDRTIYFFVSGAQRSLGRFAQRVYDNIQERRRERRRREAEEAAGEASGNAEGEADAGSRGSASEEGVTETPEGEATPSANEAPEAVETGDSAEAGESAGTAESMETGEPAETGAAINDLPFTPERVWRALQGA